MRVEHCSECGAPNPGVVSATDTGRLVCFNRRACEARQMLNRGEDPALAAAHAQGLADVPMFRPPKLDPALRSGAWPYRPAPWSKPLAAALILLADFALGFLFGRIT